MKYYRLTNLIFNKVKEYAGRKELMLDTQFSSHTIEGMVEDGEPRHGYILDEIEKEDFEMGEAK